MQPYSWATNQIKLQRSIEKANLETPKATDFEARVKEIYSAFGGNVVEELPDNNEESIMSEENNEEVKDETVSETTSTESNSEVTSENTGTAVESEEVKSDESSTEEVAA